MDPTTPNTNRLIAYCLVSVGLPAEEAEAITDPESLLFLGPQLQETIESATARAHRLMAEVRGHLDPYHRETITDEALAAHLVRRIEKDLDPEMILPNQFS